MAEVRALGVVELDLLHMACERCPPPLVVFGLDLLVLEHAENLGRATGELLLLGAHLLDLGHLGNGLDGLAVPQDVEVDLLELEKIPRCLHVRSLSCDVGLCICDGPGAADGRRLQGV